MRKWKQDCLLQKNHLSNNESGITLVELLAAISILMILVLVMGSFHIFGLRQFNNQTEAASQANDLSYALTVLSNDIRKESYASLAESEVNEGEVENIIRFNDGPTFKVDSNILKKDDFTVVEQVKEMKVTRNDSEKSIDVELTGTDLQTSSKVYRTTIYPRGGSQMLNHKIKNEEGSGLILTLMVVLVLSVLGASVATMTMGSTRLGHATQDSNSAYYIAEAGANMAYEEIRQGVVNAYNNNNELGVQATIDSLPDKYNNFDMQSGHQPEAHVSVSESETEGDKKIYTITSTGKIGPSSRTVTQKFVLTWKDKSIGGGIPNIPVGASIIAKNQIDFKGGSIEGDIYLDSLSKESFLLYNSGLTLPNKIYTNYTGSVEDIFHIDNRHEDHPKTIVNNFKSVTEQRNINLDWDSIVIELPEYTNFSRFPNELITNSEGNQYDVIKNNNIYVDNHVSNGYLLLLKDNNYFINTLKVASDYTLKIETYDKIVNLVVRNLDIGQGHIEIIGDGKVNLYVLEKLNINGSINKNNNCLIFIKNYKRAIGKWFLIMDNLTKLCLQVTQLHLEPPS